MSVYKSVSHTILVGANIFEHEDSFLISEDFRVFPYTPIKATLNDKVTMNSVKLLN